MNVDIKIPLWVKDLILEIKENIKGYDVYLGGGLLRDCYTGDRDFKDVDIFLTPNGDTRSATLYTPKGYNVRYTKSCEGHDDMRKRGVECLVEFYRRTSSVTLDKGVQYIVYDKPMTIDELALDMDITMNQVMWDGVMETSLGHSICYATEGFVESHEYGWIEFAHEYDKKRMYVRQKRMEKYYPLYDVLDPVELEVHDLIDLVTKGEIEYEGSA